MIRSMTGFGRSEQNISGRDIIVEIRSVNHRYFEYSCRVSRGFSFLEDKLKKLISESISRGKVDVFVSVSAQLDTPYEVTVNHKLAEGYVNALRELGKTYGLSDDISVSSLARYSDIFTLSKPEENEDEVWESVAEVTKQALASFVAMREAEGEKLKNDVLARAQTILSIVSQIEVRSPQTVAEYEKRLKERISELLNGTEADSQRVLTEVAVFADKIAVDEETVRLRSHFEQLFSMLESQVPTGRKLDFILQEMNREANTIGSKCTDSDIAHMVVEIKAELEKIREQIQNIE